MGNSIKKPEIIEKEGIEYDKIINLINPLDVILFKGSSFFANVVGKAEKIGLHNDSWTHAAIVVTPELIPIKNVSPNTRCVWETFMFASDEVETCEVPQAINGVQVRELADVIDTCDVNNKTRIGWCKLMNNPCVKKEGEDYETYKKRMDDVRKTLTTIYYKFNNITSYELNLFRSLGSILPIFKIFNGKPDDANRKFFCSEFVAYIFQQLNLLQKNVDPAHIAPVEFIGATNDSLEIMVENPIIITRNWSKLIIKDEHFKLISLK